MQNTKNAKELNISLLNENNDDYSTKQIDLLKQLTSMIKDNDNIKTINIRVLSEKISHEILDILKQLDKKASPFAEINILTTHHYKILHTENKIWNVKTIIDANSYIENICKKIKQKNLSPAEALSFIHLQIQSLVKYSPSKQTSWCSNDQLFVGAFLEKPEFVCLGRCSLMKHIIDTLNLNELSCNIVALTTFNLETSVKEEHARLHILLKDKKYHIDDEFYDDATWDCIDETDEIKYAHLFMPKNCHLEDMSKYDFYNFDYKVITKNNEHKYVRFEPFNEWSTEVVKPLEQKLIEKIVFASIVKTSNDSLESLYDKMQKMAKASFEEQKTKKYKFALNQPELAMTKQQALQLYCEIKSQEELTMYA